MENLAIFSKATFSLIFVIILLYAVIKLVNKYIKYSPHGKNKANIKIDSVFFVDQASKVVNISANNKSYLVLISQNGNILLDKNEKQ